MKVSTLLIIGVVGYFVYKNYNPNQSITVNEKDLIPINKLNHDKNYNPLYDPSTGNSININHTFTDQVMETFNGKKYAFM